MKKLLFITMFDYPTRYAHAVHGLFMARAFSRMLGNNFLFLVNEVKDPALLTDVPHAGLFGTYGRRIKKLRLRRVLFPFVLIWFFLSKREWRGSVVLINDPRLFPVVSRLKNIFGLRLIYEAHGIPDHALLHVIAHSAESIVCTTEGIKKHIIEHIPNIAGKTSVIPNAVDTESFDRISSSKETLRHELNLPKDKMLIGYIGRFAPLGEDKGLSLMIDALRELSADVLCVFVGGAKKEIAEYTEYARIKEVADRAIFIEHVDATRVPTYAKAFDILAYIPEGKSSYFEVETSPMKLFEYMAARQPIIVSDLPTVREILDENTALLVTPGSVAAFVAAVREVAIEQGAAVKRIEAAYMRVKENTWSNRARRLIELS